MGIQNIGSKAHVLPQDIQLIIQRCETQQVVFMLDADWDELSDKLKPGDAVDQRPRSFFYAVKNYKEYMRTLVNLRGSNGRGGGDHDGSDDPPAPDGASSDAGRSPGSGGGSGINPPAAVPTPMTNTGIWRVRARWSARSFSPLQA